MARVAVQFVASSNMGAVSGDIAKINAQLAALAANLKKVGASNPAGIRAIERSFLKGTNAIAGFEAQQMSTQSVTSRLTKDINRQKVAWKDMAGVRKNISGLVDEQLRLKKAVASVTSSDLTGRINGQLVAPVNAYATAAERAAMKTGIMGRALQSAGMDMVRTGKQMQWTGRQISSGFTLPIVALAAVAGKAAYDIDASLVRLTKVYGDLSGASSKELQQVREDTTKTAKTVAKEFGIAGKETTDLGGDLAAMGYQGQKLQTAIYQTSRIATLGELDRTQAINLTRSAMSAFGYQIDELGDKFNFLNAIENSTSTTLQDLSEAIPRVAPVVADLGGSMEDAAVFTVAFRKAGYTAAQGANALRSSLGAILAPSKSVKKSLMEMNIDIDALMAQHPGDIMAQLTDIGAAMDNLTGPQRQKALATLFGRYQFGKMGTLLKSLVDDARDTSTEVGKAFQITQASTSDLARVAQSELTQQAESTSGRIKRAAATIKLEFAELGRPILKVVAEVTEKFAAFLTMVNKIPGPIKAIIAGVFGILAIGGPLLYFAGLFKAMVGTAISFTGRMLGMKSGVQQLTTAEEQFAILANSQVTPAIQRQAGSVEALTMQLQMAADAYTRLATTGKTGSLVALSGKGTGAAGRKAERAAEKARLAERTPYVGGVMNGPVVGTPQQMKDANRQYALSQQMATSEAKLGRFARVTADQRERSSRAMGRTVASGAAMSAMMIQVLGPSKTWLNIVTGVLMAMAMMPGQIAKITNKLLASKLMAGTTGTTGVITKANKAVGALKTALVNLPGPAKIVGAAIVAIGTALYAIHKNAKKIEADNKKAMDGAKDLAAAVGATWNEAGVHAETAAKKAIDANKKAADEWKKNNPQAVEQLRREYNSGKNVTDKERRAVTAAEDLGRKVYNHTGDARAANDAAKAALTAAGLQTLKVRVNLDFKDKDDVSKKNAEMYARDMKKIINDEFHKSGWFSWVPTFSDPGLSGDQKNAIDKLVKNFSDRISNGMEDMSARGDIKTSMQELMDQYTKQFAAVKTNWKPDKKDSNILMGLGINPNDTARLNEYLAVAGTAGVIEDGLSVHARDAAVDLTKVGWAAKQTTDDLLKNIGVSRKVVAEQLGIKESAVSLREVMTWLTQTFGSVEQAQTAYNDVLTDARESHKALAPWEQENAANLIIAKYNLTGVTAQQLMSNTATDAAKKAMEEAAGAATDYTEQISNLSSALRSASSEELQKAADIGFKAFDKQTEAQDKAYDKRGDAVSKYYDGEKKKLDKRYDDENDQIDATAKKQIDAVNNRIDAIQKEDDARQKMYEHEKTRLQRLADAANSNIDFNVAMNSGDMDEAARISNSAYATYMQNQIDDAMEGADDASKVRKTAADKEIDTIQKRADARKADVENARTHAEELLQIEEDNAKDRIQNSKDAYDEMRADQKAALTEQVKAFIDAGATGQADWAKQMGGIQKAFDAAHVTTLKSNGEWNSRMANGFAASLEAVRAKEAGDKKWEAFGKHLSDLMAGGATNGKMNWDQLWTYLTTGEMPAAPAPKPKAAPATNHYSEGTAPSKRYPHGGGHIGAASFQSKRPGRSLSDPKIYPDEVPAVLQKGEYVINKNAVRQLGVDTLHKINQGKLVGGDSTGRYHDGGAVNPVAGTVATGLMGMMSMALRTAIERRDAANAEIGKPTIFATALGDLGGGGGSDLAGDQLANARIIMQVGRSMGASNRDLIVSIMTALQESNLKNISYGDRDSLGLFQQRPSQGWGTPGEIMQPQYAARKFFEGLLKIKDRDQMALTQEAQAVQRSGFPQAYAKWEATARAIVGGTYRPGGVTAGNWGNPDDPGYAAKNIETRSELGLRWTQNRLVGDKFQRLIDALESAGYIPKSVQGYNNRNIAHSARKSNHAYGAAVDIDPGRNPRYGNPSGGPYGLPRNSGMIARNLGLNWGGTYNSSKDYMHFEALGAPASPKMKTGGYVKFDNTIANLHKNETVLTAPLSKKLHDGINNMDNSSHPVYNVTINATGDMNVRQLAREVRLELQKLDANTNKNRRIS